MHIFITGIAGFIGYHVAQALKARGNQVTGCDNFNTYYDPRLKEQRAAQLSAQGIQVERQDVRSLQLPEGVTHVVHLAAQAGVRYSMTHPEKYVESNLDGFVSVLEAVRKAPATKLIYASSSSVYGANPKLPFAEEDPTDHPCSLYGATKKANEVMAYAYHHMYGLACTALRFFTVYGPWGRPDMAYYSFAEKIEKGEELAIYNGGKMRRDFTYIDDIVQGVVAAIDLGAAYEIFNLGNHRPEEVLHLVALLESGLGKKACIRLLGEQKSEVPATYADISKAAQQLGFCPKTSLEAGVGQFLEWFKSPKSRAKPS